MVDEIPRIKFPDRFNCVDAFADSQVAMGNAERTAIVSTNGTASYGELAQQLRRYGKALLDLGIAPGERVALLLHDCAEFIYLFMGAIRVGILPVPLSTALGTGDYAYIILSLIHI